MLQHECPLAKNRLRYSRERALQNLATTEHCMLEKRTAQAGFPDAPGAGSPGRPVPASRPPQARGPEKKRVGRLGTTSRGKLPPSVKKEKVFFIPNSMFLFSQIYSNLLRSFDPFGSATGRGGTGTGAVAGSAGSQQPHGLVPGAPFWVGWRALDRF